jgi:hypothetical protein
MIATSNWRHLAVTRVLPTGRNFELARDATQRRERINDSLDLRHTSINEQFYTCDITAVIRG